MIGRLLGARLRDERGSVGVLLSFVIFVVVGMLMMTWNTAQLSKEKMRLQNAADAAALEHAIWQARGLNAVQNLNDEAYFSVQTAFVLTTVAAALETAAKSAELIPFVRHVLPPVLRFGATIVGGAGSILGHSALIVIKFAGYFYHYGSAAFGYIGAMQLAKENGATAIFPALNAVKAKAFGDFRLGVYALGFSLARPLSTFVLPLKRIKIEGDLYHVPSTEMLFAGKWYGVYSALKIGAEWDFQPLVSSGDDDEQQKPETPTPPSPETVALKGQMEALTNQIARVEAECAKYRKELADLEERMKPSAKLGIENPEDVAEKRRLEAKIKRCESDLNDLSRKYVKLAEKLSRGTKPGPYRGSGGGLPGSTVWVAFRAKNAIETLNLETWSPGTSSSAMYDAPIVAISAARCVSGDVIPHNRMPKAGEPNQRPVGFGTGATAKLVPVLEALAELGERGEKWKKVSTALQYAVGAVVYH